MTSPSQRPDWRRNQAAVTVATFIGFTGFTLVMPFLPLYFELLGEHDAGRIAIWSGVSLGVTPAITAVMVPIWARAADRYGRKLMVARSLAAFIVIMAAMAAVERPWHVFALRALLGLFAGYGSIALTMAAESAPPESITSAIGWVQTAQRLGPALGPVIGGALAQAVGLRFAFVVSAFVYLAAFLLVVAGYREGPRSHASRERSQEDAASFAALRRVPHFVLFMASVFGLQLVDRSFGPILPLYLADIGAPETRIPVLSGTIFTITAAAAAFGNQLTSWLVSRARIAQIVAVACLLAGAAASVFAVGPALTGLIASAVIFGLGMGVATTAVYTGATQAVSPASRGMAFGYLTTAYLVGLAVSPVVAGLVGSQSVRAVFVLDAVGLSIAAVVIWSRMKGEGSA